MSAQNHVCTSLEALWLCGSSDTKPVEAVPVKVHFTVTQLETSFCQRGGCHEGGWGLGDPGIAWKALSLFSPALHACADHTPNSVTPWTGSPPGSLCPQGFSRQRTLEWVAMPFSHGVFPTQGLKAHIPCTGWRALYHWATWEAGVGALAAIQTVKGWSFKIRWNQMQAFNSKEGAASAAVWGDDDLSPLKINTVTCLC